MRHLTSDQRQDIINTTNSSSLYTSADHAFSRFANFLRCPPKSGMSGRRAWRGLAIRLEVCGLYASATTCHNMADAL